MSEFSQGIFNIKIQHQQNDKFNDIKYLKIMCQEMSGVDKNTNGNNFSQIVNSQELRSNLQNISSILNTGLTPETLDICIQLCEAGVHPQALANVIQQIRREVAQIQHDSNNQQ
ncbi:CLUMA_CG021421, isoform A [Clunio marinus]|uniref:CLUMA_CG021421, isoform A n=1 Tax=Clunio marinus TaxID=568069 RepID=A0A1J1J8J2_9DIPT|nr:CLUMA_CG021421, isoform A [Clunio marinus]